MWYGVFERNEIQVSERCTSSVLPRAIGTSDSNMRSPTYFARSAATLSTIYGIAFAQSGSTADGISFPDPTGVSTAYSSTTYNISAASTTLANDDYSDERLDFLWKQVGPISTGPVTETAEPTPEPSAYGNPSNGYHPYIPSYAGNLSEALLPEGFAWGVASSAFQIEVRRRLATSHDTRSLTATRAPLTRKAKVHRSGTS